MKLFYRAKHAKVIEIGSRQWAMRRLRNKLLAIPGLLVFATLLTHHLSNATITFADHPGETETVTQMEDRLESKYECSPTPQRDAIPAHALVLRDGRVLVTSFAEGMMAYDGSAVGKLLALCLK